MRSSREVAQRRGDWYGPSSRTRFDVAQMLGCATLRLPLGFPRLRIAKLYCVTARNGNGLRNSKFPPEAPGRYAK